MDAGGVILYTFSAQHLLENRLSPVFMVSLWHLWVLSAKDSNTGFSSLESLDLCLICVRGSCDFERGQARKGQTILQPLILKPNLQDNN